MTRLAPYLSWNVKEKMTFLEGSRPVLVNLDLDAESRPVELASFFGLRPRIRRFGRPTSLCSELAIGANSNNHSAVQLDSLQTLLFQIAGTPETVDVLLSRDTATTLFEYWIFRRGLGNHALH
jgi:hypothetical protein